MGKIAFVFSGQGAQHPGMGQSLCASSPAAAEIFREADALRPGTSDQCFSGTAEALMVTSNTQPCMFAVELAAAHALLEGGVQPDMLAGFSLGEVAALTFSGAVSFGQGFHLVCRRGAFMQAAAEQFDTAMAAVVKLDNDTVRRLCASYKHVYPVNYNCPGQVSVAGLKDELETFKADVKAAGGRAIPLKVAGAFHSPFMAAASVQLSNTLAGMDIQPPKIPLYANCTAQPYAGGTEDFRDLLIKQVKSPVLWQETVEHMIEAGADTFIEVGPGKTLCGLIAKISGDVRVLNVEDADSLAAALSEVHHA